MGKIGHNYTGVCVIAVVLCLIGASASFADEDTSIGQAGSEGQRIVRAGSDFGRTTGRGFKEAGKGTGRFFKEFGKGTGHVGKEFGKSQGKFWKNFGLAVAKPFSK